MKINLDVRLAKSAGIPEKGLCYLEIINAKDGPTARASPTQIRGAANAIIMGCVADADSQGGIAVNFGESY